jgi:hypothetical protein
VLLWVRDLLFGWRFLRPGQWSHAGAAGRVSEAGAEVVLLVTECCHPAGEFLDLLHECGGRLTNASERRLRCGLGDAIRVVGCGVQTALAVPSEDGL